MYEGSDLHPVIVDALPATQTTMPIGGPLSWERAMEAWQGRLKSKETRSTYKAAVKQFFSFGGVPIYLDEITVAMLDEYGGALRHRAEKGALVKEPLAPATANTYLSALRSFLTFCRKRGWLSEKVNGELIADALSGIKGKTQRPYQIVETGEEWDRLLDAAATDHYNPMRAVALVTLALGSGLRIGELCALDVGNICVDAKGVFIDVQRGKGDRDRQVPITEDVYLIVMRYLEETGRTLHRTTDRALPLFASRRHDKGPGRITTRHAGRIIGEAVTKAGIERKHLTAHSLRHSYAIRVLKGNPEEGQEGAPLPALQKLLGHSSIAVTGRYTAHFERGELMKYAPQVQRKAV